MGLAQPYVKVKEVTSLSHIRHAIQPQKVLVCTPSNAGVDEILRRIKDEGVFNEHGKPDSKVPVIRMGPGVHPTLIEYSLEEMLKRDKSAKIGEQAEREHRKEKLIAKQRIVCT